MSEQDEEQLELAFDAHGYAWMATPAKSSTMSKVVEVHKRGDAVLEHRQHSSVMTRRMVRPATPEEIERWRES